MYPRNESLEMSPAMSRPSGKMTLAGVRKGVLSSPIRALIYGVEGVGKSSFAACAPNPIFLCSEAGTNYLDVSRFATADSFNDVQDALQVLIDEEHPYESTVIDTLDWLEPFVWRTVVKNASPNKEGKRPKSIDEVGGGYNKGYEVALDYWRQFLSKLETLRTVKGMHVILISHAWVKPFSNPAGPDFDRYELKLHKKAAGLFKEWADDVLFATFDTYTSTQKGETKGRQGATRIIHTEHRATHDAKNRCGLPEQLPLNWGSYFSAWKARQARPMGEMAAELKSLLAILGKSDKLEDTLRYVGTDTTRMANMLNKARFEVDQHNARFDNVDDGKLLADVAS